jgi:hypothetical protein
VAADAQHRLVQRHVVARRRLRGVAIRTRAGGREFELRYNRAIPVEIAAALLSDCAPLRARMASTSWSAER